ncbi:MAG: L-threonylcarbamoyladenylate synthase [Thermotogota bacterium]|nr:L-threonylcarbamoyladenylate synthase [Thermotogota bacterium]MDK2863881.1 L-threonylcarbamoyladenylate synthase [Thermotogota bacterium]HCZ06524.1 threonylcarbamoyl-AMP synthase [Thermotogota bacterium]
MRSKIIKLKDFREAEVELQEAAEVIRRGGIVVFPTETVYGLGANAFDENAVRRIFEAKGRPVDNPLIVHIASLSQLDQVVSQITPNEEIFERLYTKLWPGPATFIMPRNKKVPPIVSGGLDTVGVRMPAHPLAMKLIELAEVPVAAPSANLSGRPSPTDEHHVLEDMDGRADVIVLAGRTPLGVESTVIDLTVFPPRLLRPGPIDPESLESILGVGIQVDGLVRGLSSHERPVSPGMKYRHYAPSKPLVLIEGSEEFILNEIKRFQQKHSIAVICSTQLSRRLKGSPYILPWGDRNDPFSAARNLFEFLRKAEKLPVDVIVTEGLEEKGIGLAVMNRLRRAASKVIRE